MINKLNLVLLGVLLTTLTAHAQETPRGELSGGYSYLRMGFSNGVNAHGGSFSVAGNANSWLGLAGDFGFYHASPSGVSVNTFTYMGGPRLSYRSSSAVTPFAQVLVGGMHTNVGFGSLSVGVNGFAFGVGGGVDAGISKHAAFRTQFDYIAMRAQGSTLHTGRVTVGIVYRFGQR